MRAREPDHVGLLDRDGVRVGYEVHGDAHGNDPLPIVFLPTFPLIDTYELFKAQIPHFARRRRVLVLDPRAHGRSSRPTDPAAYLHDARLGDLTALLDATGTERAVLIGMSQGAQFGLRAAADDPDRVHALVALSASFVPDEDNPVRDPSRPLDPQVWADRDVWHFRPTSWRDEYADFVRWLIEQVHTEPHSIKHIEDGLRYGHETTPEAIAAHALGFDASWPPPGQSVEDVARQVRCPVMIVHGSDDRLMPLEDSERVAVWCDARLEVLDGAGHGVHGRRPVQVNALIDDFLDEVDGPPDRSRAPQAPQHTERPRRASTGSGPRVLYLSSPIGLGHARRDLAIADELRRLAPGTTIEWLAQDPVTRVLSANDEAVHPASRHLANESAHIESEAGEHQLHVMETVRRMDEILVANFMVFLDAVREGNYDLVVGDEAWDVDHFLHEDPSVKATRFAWLTDFVGELPLPAHGRRGVEVTADRNAEMIGHIDRHPDVRDTAIFVGDPDDVVDLPFGPGLPNIRAWTREHYQFGGYVTGFDPGTLGDRDDLRAAYGYAPDELICVAAVGGSGVGTALLRRIITAHQLALRQLPALRTVLVTGPRIDPASLPDAPRLDKHAYIADLHRRFAAADLAVVQGGLTTTMELTALGVPFLYVPLIDHFEQQIHVRHRLQRYDAGTAVDYATTSAEALADLMTATAVTPTAYRPVATDGAQRAAHALVRLL